MIQEQEIICLEHSCILYEKKYHSQNIFIRYYILYPYIEILPWFSIYIFWLTLCVCFFLFLWKLKRLSKRFGYSFTFFSQNVLWYFLSIFIFSRLFYVLSRWNDMKFIKNPFEFFIMNDFNFSLFWAIFWFLVVTGVLLRIEKSSFKRYIDGIVLSFLLIMTVWYFWALFGWQVYGKETMYGIEISYQHFTATVPFQVPIFPLPIVYGLLSFLLFSGMYILSLFVHVRGFVGYLWIIVFCAMIIVFESFSGKQDILSVTSMFNLPQVFALVLATWSGYKFYWIFSDTWSSEIHSE